jgi:4-amino-4-deoxychorismate lyase
MPLIDGRPGDRIACADRGLQYGDGLFETISCRDGQPRWLPLHIERLRTGLRRLHLPFREFDALQGEICTLASGQERCLIKLVVTRGTATRRGYAPSGAERPTRIVSRHEWPASGAQTSGFRVGVSDVRLGVNPLLAGLKHLNRLEQVLAQMQCVDAGLDEVLMLSASAHAISGSMSNMFFADQSGLFTPELRECGVAGVMRRVVLRSAAAAAIPIQVRVVSSSELLGVHEVFLTNVRLGIQSVSRLDGRTLASDDYAQRLRRVIDETNA